MRYTFLGKTGTKISELCLGAMTFGTEWGWGADEAESRRIFDAYREAGGNFIDTADAYTGGTSERFVGQFVKGERDRWVIATKYTIATDLDHANAHGNGAKNFRASIDASLKRLGTDYVDLYYAHIWDGFTPVEEVMRAMEDAVRAGKVLHVGLSDYPAWLVARAEMAGEIMRTVRPAAIQVEYNLAQREAERELIPMAEHLGMSVLDWSPLGGGVLTGKTLKEGGDGKDGGRVSSGAVRHFDKYRTEHAHAVTRAVVGVAKEVGASPAQVAIAWLRQRAPLHVPIVGARSAAHIKDNLKAVDIVLPEEIAARLDTVSMIDLGFPSTFYRNGWKDWYGGWPTRLDPRVRPQGRTALGLELPSAV